MTNEESPIFNYQLRLWRLARWSFVILVIGIGVAVSAVGLGLADPKPYGELQWEDRLTTNTRWQLAGREMVFTKDGLLVTLPKADDVRLAVSTAEAVPPFTLEAAGWQTTGPAGAWYGVVFDYHDADHYTAVLVNGNGYVQVFEPRGKMLLAAQEWPSVQYGRDANRVRVDVANGEGVVRINDEILTRVPARGGRTGLMAQASAPNQQVQFNWVKWWSK